MEHVIYSSTIIPSRHNKHSGDVVVAATVLNLTEERNCLAVWLRGPDYQGEQMVKWFMDYERNAAIEWAVIHAAKLKSAPALTVPNS